MTSLPLPKGRRGLPLLGETLSFLKDPFAFVQSRIDEHGPVFRTHLLGRNTVVVAGPKAAELWLDEERLTREGATPGHIKEIFGGLNLGLIDGAAHRTRKTQLLAGFGAGALARYLPDIQAKIEAFLAASTEGEIHGVAALKQLAFEAIAQNVLSLGPKDPRLARLLALFQIVAAGFMGLPVAIPGGLFSKAKKARDEIFAILRQCLDEHRKAPADFDDGLSRILAFQTEAGESISDEEALLELLHIHIAGYIVFGQLTRMLVELSHDADLVSRLHAEVAAQAPSGPLSLRTLLSLPLVNQVVKEVKRVTPMIPTLFARARKDFEWEGYSIPKGFGVFYALRASHELPSVFALPHKFDPSRFDAIRREHEQHPWAFVPQGPGPDVSHKCPGTDYATVVMASFLVLVLRQYAFDIPEQDLTYRWALIPPEPVDGLRISFRLGRGAKGPAGQELSRSESKADVRLDKAVLLCLTAIIWADDRVTREEADALEAAGELVGLNNEELGELREACKRRIPLDETVLAALSEEQKVFVFALASYFAEVDGDLHDREVAELERLATTLNLSTEERGRAGAAALAVASVGAGGLEALVTALQEDAVAA